MRFVCDSCRAQYMISDDKVGAKGVKVRCKKCGYVILVRKADGETTQVAPMPQAPEAAARESDATGPAQLGPEPGTRPGGEASNGNGVHANGANGSAENGASAPVSSFGGNGGNGFLGGVE